MARVQINRPRNSAKRQTFSDGYRLRWRHEHILLDSKQIHCKTFDQLCDDLLDRLEQFPIATRAEEKKVTDEAKAGDKVTVEKTSDTGV
jgi:hypothetical protein